MQTIEVDKKQLQAILLRNRKDHQEKYQAAMEGYRAEVLAGLKKLVQSIANGGKIEKAVTTKDRMPEDHTKDYNRAILMAEMSVSETMSLDQDDFEQYVQDQWHWSATFSSSCSSYSSSSSSPE
jgi:hypothetical protein